ncbi:MAG: S8 family serine peptidase [Acidobacteria bacterium]|nr:S8 family serine peptidase [Acidobacteriota bacterium]
MRLRVSPLLVLLLALTFGGQAPRSQTGLAIPADVVAQVTAEGSALVIIGVRTAFVPEGLLAGAAEVNAQRDAMHAAVDNVMGRAAAAGAIVGQRFETIPYFTARVSQAALAALAASGDVTTIGLDALHRPLLAQSVPLVNAPAAWSAGHTGAGWKVAILDTGVDKTHGFLSGKVAADGEACYSDAGGLGSGTSVCPGGASSSTAVGSGVPCSATIDGCDHGTHVAGIATGFNGPGGINGVAPGAGLIALQVFTRFDDTAICGTDPGDTPCILSYTSDQVLALERVLTLAGASNVNRVASANMSLGGPAIFTSACDTSSEGIATKAAIDNLLSVGIATAIATGNNYSVSAISAPACISSAVAVGSTTKLDAMSNFGNRRPGLVDLLAPGSSINSSVPGNLFSVFSGTSMATPHVAGAWAILKQAVPAAGVAQVLSALQSTGAVINDTASGGSYPRINVDAARQALLGGTGVPGPPGTPTISGAGNAVNINWSAPATGGLPTSYTVLARLAPGGSVVTTLPVGNVLGTSVTAPNGTFHVTVRASNASGTGPESAGVTFNVPIVAPPPGAPTNLNVVVSGNQASFTWTPPSTGGTATGYLLVAALSSGGAPIAQLPFPAPATGANVTNIPPGTYFVRLAATNSGGTSPLSNEVTVGVAGPQVPGAPTMNAPTVGGGMVGLSWSAPTTGGAPTSYQVLASVTSGGAPVAALEAGLNTSISVPAPPGTYFVRARGVNAAGPGPLSNEVQVVVP